MVHRQKELEASVEDRVILQIKSNHFFMNLYCS